MQNEELAAVGRLLLDCASRSTEGYVAVFRDGGQWGAKARFQRSYVTATRATIAEALEQVLHRLLHHGARGAREGPE